MQKKQLELFRAKLLFKSGIFDGYELSKKAIKALRNETIDEIFIQFWDCSPTIDEFAYVTPDVFITARGFYYMMQHPPKKEDE